MRLCTKTLYPAPLLDIEILANERKEMLVAFLMIIKLIDFAQEKYKAFPNDKYLPEMNKNIQEGIIIFKAELIFPKVEDSNEFVLELKRMI